MHRIKCVGATFAPYKMQICRPKALIVGMQCTPEGRLPDPDQVTKVLQWEKLNTPKDARKFLGLCGTVRNWIQGYSELARPLSELYHEEMTFKWTKHRQAAFNELKRQIAEAKAIRPLDYSSENPVTLSVEVNYIALGCALSQLDDQGASRPAWYGSLPVGKQKQITHWKNWSYIDFTEFYNTGRNISLE